MCPTRSKYSFNIKTLERKNVEKHNFKWQRNRKGKIGGEEQFQEADAGVLVRGWGVSVVCNREESSPGLFGERYVILTLHSRDAFHSTELVRSLNDTRPKSHKMCVAWRKKEGAKKKNGV